MLCLCPALLLCICPKKNLFTCLVQRIPGTYFRHFMSCSFCYEKRLLLICPLCSWGEWSCLDFADLIWFRVNLSFCCWTFSTLLEAPELSEYSRIRGFFDEDYETKTEFTVSWHTMSCTYHDFVLFIDDLCTVVNVVLSVASWPFVLLELQTEMYIMEW